MADFLAGPITDPLPQRLTPASVSLVDGANIALDASQGDVFLVTLAGNRTLSAPTNPKGGQRFTLIVTQDAVGGRTLTFDAAYTDVSAVSLNSTASGVTVLQFITVVSSAGAYTHSCVSSSTQAFQLSKIKTGTVVMLPAGGGTITASVGALYNSKPVFVTIADNVGALGAALPQFKASVAAGTLTITAIVAAGTAQAPTANITLNYLIDGR
jgi:hypothetical protein